MRHVKHNGYELYYFYCEGCEDNHSYRTAVPEGLNGVTWNFNGNLEKPTFTPSFLRNGHESIEKLKARGSNRCHLFVTNGIVEYCSDCSHSLAGQKRPLQAPRNLFIVGIDDQEEKSS